MRPALRHILALAALLVAASAGASERSELLVAQGEVAYHAGKRDEARRLFLAALEADPNDNAARGWLDVIEATVPGARRALRPEREARRWDLEAGGGVQYDTNPRLDPHGGDRKDDAGFLFTLSGHYDPYRDDRTLVRLDYDFFQVLHTEEDDFDVRSNNFRGTFARAVWPSLWLGLQGGYNHTTLHSHAYLQEPWLLPYVSIVEGDVGSTQLTFGYGWQDFLGSPFGDTRDGTVDAAGVSQLFFLFDRRLTFSIGYLFDQEHPYKAAGDDFARNTQQGSIGFRFPAVWRSLVEVDYIYRYDDYTEPNSAVNFRKTRQDNGQYVSAVVRRNLLPHLDGVLSYFATVNGSNIPEFAYTRHIIAFELRYLF